MLYNRSLAQRNRVTKRRFGTKEYIVKNREVVASALGTYTNAAYSAKNLRFIALPKNTGSLIDLSLQITEINSAQ